MPVLEGQNKQYLLECNYVAERIIRMIKERVKGFRVLEVVF